MVEKKKAEIPGEVPLGNGTHVERPLGAVVANLRSVGGDVDVPGTGRDGKRQDDIFAVALVPGEAHVRDIIEQPQIGAQLQLTGALGFELGGSGGVAEESAEAILRGGEISSPPILEGAAAEEGEHGQIWIRLGAHLAIGGAKFAEGESAAQVDHLAKLPGGAGTGIPAPQVILPKARGPVIAQAGLEEQLVRDIQRALPEVAYDVNLGLVVDRRELARGVGERERLGRQKAVADAPDLPLSPAVQVLSQGEAATQALAQLVGRRAGQVMVHLLIHQVDLDHLSQRVSECWTRSAAAPAGGRRPNNPRRACS